MRTCTLKLQQFIERGCYFRVSRYKNGAMLIHAYQTDEYGCEEPVLTATVNLGELPADCAVIKSYSENEGLLECLTELGIVKSMMGYVPSGYVYCPVCKIDLQVLREYSIGFEDKEI